MINQKNYNQLFSVEPAYVFLLRYAAHKYCNFIVEKKWFNLKKITQLITLYLMIYYKHNF